MDNQFLFFTVKQLDTYIYEYKDVQTSLPVYIPENYLERQLWTQIRKNNKDNNCKDEIITAITIEGDIELKLGDNPHIEITSILRFATYCVPIIKAYIKPLKLQNNKLEVEFIDCETNKPVTIYDLEEERYNNLLESIKTTTKVFDSDLTKDGDETILIISEAIEKPDCIEIYMHINSIIGVTSYVIEDIKNEFLSWRTL
jgi:hypothetical protein